MARAAVFLEKDHKTESLTVPKAYVNAMRCARCDGLMVFEQYFDFTGDAGYLNCLARRCVQCGEIIDPVILLNRRQQFGDVSGGDQRSRQDTGENFSGMALSKGGNP